MPVLVTSKFDEDWIKNEWASLVTPFFHYKSVGNFLRCSKAPNSVRSGLIWPKFKLFRDFMPIFVTCKFEKDLIERWRHRFPHYKSMGAFCCHRNQSFDPIYPKTLCSLSPIPVMLHIKFDQDWPTGHIQVSSEKLWQNHRMTEGQGKSSIAPTFSKRAIMTWVQNVEKVTKINLRILAKLHVHPQTMTKKNPVTFQKDWHKTVRVGHTRYPL